MNYPVAEVFVVYSMAVFLDLLQVSFKPYGYGHFPPKIYTHELMYTDELMYTLAFTSTLMI